MASERILLVGKMFQGETEWRLTPPAALEPLQDTQPADGELQDTIDYGAELQELQDARDDEEFWARGQW